MFEAPGAPSLSPLWKRAEFGCPIDKPIEAEEAAWASRLRQAGARRCPLVRASSHRRRPAAAVEFAPIVFNAREIDDHDPRAAWERCGACRPAMQESPFGELGFMPTRGAGSESS